MPIDIKQLIGKQINQPALGAMQEDVKTNLVLDARLPKMAAQVVAPPVAATALRMAAQPVAAQAAAGAATMKAFNPGERVAVPVRDLRLADMQGHPEVAATTAAAATGESYLRLRVRASGDSLKVIGVTEVAGPLLTPQTIVGQHAYEVTLDSKTVAVEGLPDLGEQRSFPKPGTNEHFITPRQSFDFNVRIPKAAVPDQALPRIAVTLYRFPDASAKLVQGKLSAQPGLQAKAVAQLPALRVDTLDPAVHDQIQRIFPKLTLTPKTTELPK